MIGAKTETEWRVNGEGGWGVCFSMMVWLDRVKTCFQWDKADRARIAELCRWLDSDVSGIVESLAKLLEQLKGAQPLMSNARFVWRLHSVLHEWLMGLLNGAFDGQYAKERWVFGQRLLDADLTFADVIMLGGIVRSQFFELAQERLEGYPEELSATMRTLDKALDLDLALIYSGYLQVHDAEMERALLDRFLTITGFSRTLYENLAEAQERKQTVQ